MNEIFKKVIISLIFFAIICLAVPIVAATDATTSFSNIQLFPSDYIWNVPIDKLPVHPNSSDYIRVQEYGNKIVPHFGSSPTSGMPCNIVDNSVLMRNASFRVGSVTGWAVGLQWPWPDPYPNIEAAQTPDTCPSGWDCHSIIYNKDTKMLYEVFGNKGLLPNGSINASSASVWNTAGYDIISPAKAANVAGTPMLPGMVKYDEIQSGVINHALTTSIPWARTGKYIWPAVSGGGRGSNVTTDYPPMGTRFRLKASFDISGYPADDQVILTAMKKYGMIVTDNGFPGTGFAINGLRDSRWDWSHLVLLENVKGTDLEAVDESSLMIAKDSGKARIVPVANFSAMPFSGNAPLKVQFTDNSGNTPSAWTWTFGDGSEENATVQNPVHTYATAGNYTVILNATNAAGSNLIVRTDYIKVTSLSSILITSPRGGEIWLSSTTPVITWTSTENPGNNVKLELLKSGTVVQTISGGTANDGVFSSWTIPANQAAGSDYKIKITSLSNPAITGTSAGTFTISTPSLTVTSPKGEEIWLSSTTPVITWTSTENPGNNVKLELLKSGTVVQTISGGTANDGVFSSWTIPANQAAGSDYKIKITSLSNPAITGTSAGTFTISPPSLTVTSPKGGEIWLSSTTPVITWTSTENPGNNVKLELLKSGTVVQTISGGTANDGVFSSWTIPANQAAGSDYKIKITSLSNPAITGTSAGTFTISPPSLTVTSPKGGEIWLSSTTPMITWTSTENPGSNVKIELLKSGTVVQTISGGTANDGIFSSWTIPANQAAAADYKIRITSLSNPAITGTSAGTFTISTPSLTVTSPKGGEIWLSSTTPVITWTSTENPGSNVKIELLKSGTVVQTISGGTANDGIFSSWTIPANQAAAADYKIRITSLSNPAITGTSTSDFTITKAADSTKTRRNYIRLS